MKEGLWFTNEKRRASSSLCFTLLGTKGRISQFTSRRLNSRLPRLTFCVEDVESRALGRGTRMLKSKGSEGPQLEFCCLASSLSGAGLMPRPTHTSICQRRVSIAEKHSQELAYFPSFATCWLWDLGKSFILSDLNFFICKLVMTVPIFAVYVIG